MSNELERFLLQKSAQAGKPAKVTLELSPLCNFICEMCYIRHSKSEMNQDGGAVDDFFWENLIPQLKELGVLFVCLIGGEPFLHPRIQYIYEKLFDEGFLVNITTNAALLANGIPDWLRKKPPRYITVSLYGASDQTYEIVTGNGKGYSMTIAGIENLLYENIDVKLNFLASPNNVYDLDQIYELKNKYQLPLLATSYSFLPSRKLNSKCQARFSPIECAKWEMNIRYLNNPENYYL